MLVPTRSPHVRVDETATTASVLTEGSRRFLIPRGDAVLLPIVNTTCECLAGSPARRPSRRSSGATAYRLELRVEETPGPGRQRRRVSWRRLRGDVAATAGAIIEAWPISSR